MNITAIYIGQDDPFYKKGTRYIVFVSHAYPFTIEQADDQPGKTERKYNSIKEFLEDWDKIAHIFE